MSTRGLTILATCLLLFLCGCIPSLDPFYLQENLIFDSRLLGSWSDPENKEDRYTFEKEDDSAYQLTIRRSGKEAKFAAHLFKLKDHLFLDVLPTTTGGVDEYEASIIPGHLLYHVRMGDKLSLAFMDYEWLEKHLEAHPKELAHRARKYGKTSESYVLLASTKELQRFVLKHFKNGHLFDPARDWNRLPTTSP